MIIGNGLIAQSFYRNFGDDSNVVIFASGVSNSHEIHSEAFCRERHMLVEALHCRKKLVYFSTCSIDDPEMQKSPYVIHKKEMELLVHSANDYAIFRLPQVVGRSSNPNTLTNYLYQQITSGSAFTVWRHSRRNLIDVDDVALIVRYFIKVLSVNRITLNVASPFSVSITELVSTFELILGKQANYVIIEAGGAYLIDSDSANEAAVQMGIDFNGAYIERLIRKYYGE